MPGPSLETVRQNTAAQAVASPVGVQEIAARLPQGNYRGQAVMNVDLDSKVAQANRSLKTSFKAQNLQTIAIRMAHKGRGTHLEATSKIADFYEKLPDMPDTEKLKELVEKIHQYMHSSEEAEEPEDKEEADAGEPGEEGEEGSQDAKRDGKGGDILALLQQFDPDVSHQYAALDIAREHFESSGADPELLEHLDEAGRHFEQTDVLRDVRAGLAAGKIAKDKAATLETEPAVVRDTYRSMLREQKNFGQLFDALSKFDMLKSCDEIIGTFRTAAGRDLASTNSSTDARFLGALLTELGKLKQIKTVLDESSKLISQTERLLPDRDRGVMKPVQLTSRMLNFVAKPSPSLTDADGLLADIKSTSAAGKVVFVNAVKYMHGVVPDAMFPSFGARLLQKTTLTSLSNRLVEAEEREFEKSQGQHV